MSNGVSVLYLARLQDGLKEITEFFQSYRIFPTKVDHDLVVVVKGVEREKDCETIISLLDRCSVAANLIWVPDEIGFDIDTYKWVATHHKIQTEYILCLKTSSRICSSSWLEKYIELFADPAVGLVGATGSYESLQSSWHAILNAQQKFFVGDLPFSMIAKWKWIIGNDKKITKLFAINFFFHLKKHLTNFKFRVLTGLNSHFDYVREHYVKVTRENEIFSFTKEFPLYPNPHVRTSGFMIRTSDFKSLEFNLFGIKTDSSKFESGYRSLTRQILEKNKEVLVVGLDGKGYRIEEWEESHTFRSLDQFNLLIADNRTEDFPEMTSAVKETHKNMTWGVNESIVDVTFSRQNRVDPALNRHMGALPSISIVIPTHNGNRLIADTVSTILNQNYPNLEVIIFDNASQISISETLRAMDDQRLTIHRSNEFLSVTESWNHAIDFASSDYVMLFGDDDGLAPSFSEDFSRYIVEFKEPEVLYSNLFQAIYPGVKGKNTESEFKFHPVCERLENLREPIFLDKLSRKTMVAHSLGLRRDFFYNMPSFIVKRTLLDELRIENRVFLGPFPDYYIANILFARAEKLLLVPKPLSFQGISPSSFGHSLLTDTTDNGFKRLGHSQDSSNLRDFFSNHKLIHSNYTDEYVLTMLQVQKQLSSAVARVDLKRYRRITIFNIVKKCLNQKEVKGKLFIILKIYAALKASGKIAIKEYGFVARIGLLFILAAKLPRIFYNDLVLLQNELQIMQYQPDIYAYGNSFPQTPLDTFRLIDEIEIDRMQIF